MDILKSVKIQAPATIANIGCAFDVMGLAVTNIFDIFELQLINKPGIWIENIDEYNLPILPEQNILGIVANSILNMHKIQDVGVRILSNKMIKPGSGLGSSSASAVGAAVGMNLLFGLSLSKAEILNHAMEGEFFASKSRHADNLAPCLYGGVTLIRNLEPQDIIQLPYPNVYFAIVNPQIEMKTSEARAMLKTEVKLKDAVQQWGNVGALVAGFCKKDIHLIARSIKDIIIEPIRSKIIPCFDEVKLKSLSAGALSGSISGAGPSIFMICEKLEIAELISLQMLKIYQDSNIDAHIYVSEISEKGAFVIKF